MSNTQSLYGRAAIRLPPRGRVLALLVAAFLLPGLIGHDPWKTEDAIGWGVTYSMLQTGNWVSPQLAGEHFFGPGPLYFWVAALCSKLFAFALPAHDGARIASLLGALLALYFTRLAARELYGKPAGDLSLLALMGCLGFLIHARETAPETAALAAVAASYYGIAIAWKKPVKGGLFFGGGLAGAFLATGYPALLPPLVAALLLIPFAIADRARPYLRAVALGIAVLIPLAAGWLIALAIVDRPYFDQWLTVQWTNAINRPRLAVSMDYVKTLAWAAWPAWPLTLWAAWAYRRNLRNPGFAVPFVAALVALVLLIFTSDAREMDALVLLVPLAIPAGTVAMQLRRGAANALAWFSLMTAGLLAAALWVMWFANLTGFPARIATNVGKLEPGFSATLSPLMLIIALAFTSGWVWFIARTPMSSLRALPYWAASLTLIWGLTMTLWLGWIDYGKTYRPVAHAARAALPADAGCITSRNFGPVQRAAFHYHANILTLRAEQGAGGHCRYMFVQARADDADPLGWERLWEGSRPRDRERYRLYRRI
jgi:4-amino-4-deoxy-L-arabinose transferase-like glycosyltransferase